MTKKLTPAQQELLDAMRRGVEVHYMSPWSHRQSGYYYRSDTLERCTAAARGLRNRGLARFDYDRESLVPLNGKAEGVRA